jgi:VIT1/CCC1 family predicted Fe2+/Mn2+ transporter
LFGLIVSKEDRNIDLVYAMSCVVSGLTLFAVGAYSAYLTKQPDKVVSSGIFTLFNGTVAGTLSFLVGYIAEKTIDFGD